MNPLKPELTWISKLESTVTEQLLQLHSAYSRVEGRRNVLSRDMDSLKIPNWNPEIKLQCLA